MAYDIGPKLGIDGEAEFRKAINAVNTTIKTLGTEMAAVTSAYDKNDKSAAALASRNEVLVKQVDAQKEKLERLKEGLAASAEKYGENDEKTQKWQQAVNRATAELNGLERELSDNEQALEELARQQTQAEDATGQLTAKISEQESELGELQRQYSNAVLEYGKNSDEARELAGRIGDLSGELEENRTRLKEASDSTGDLGESLDDAGDQADGLKDRLSALGSGLAAMGKAAAAAIGAVTSAVVDFAKSSVTVGMEFDASMSQVAATMGKTTEEIGELREFAKEMGANTAFSASQAADALNYMALAGYDAETSMDMLPTVLNLAAAGGIELATASDMVTDAQSALGLSIEETTEMVDKMAMASSKSNTSVAQLGEAILTIGGTAKNLAGGTTELSTALGILADNGIKGSEGGTHLRNVILSLSSPTDKAAAALASLGVEVFDAEGNMRPLNDTLGDLNAAMASMTQAEQTNLISTIFNKTDISAVNALLANTGERWDELSGYIDDAADAAENMANTQLDNLAGDVTKFQSALEGAQIAVSEQLTPVLRELTQFGTEAIGELSTAFQEGGLSGAMDALGTILSDGLAMVIEQLPAMIDAGMQLLGALGQGLLDNLPVIVDAALSIVTTLSGGISQSLPELIPAAVDAVLQIVDTLTDPDNLGNIIEAALQIIVSLAEGLISALPKLAERVPQIIANIVTTLAANLPKITESALQIIVTLAGGLVSAIPELVKSVPQLVTSIVNGFASYASSFSDIGKNIVEGVWQGIQGMAKWIKDKVNNFFSGIVDGVKGLLGIKSPSRVFAGIGGYMAEGLGQGWDNAYSAAEKDILSNVKDTASSAAEIGKNLGDVSYSFPDVDNSVTAVRSMADAIREEIESLIGNAPDMGRRFVDGLSNGIVQGTSVLLRQVQNINAELRTGFGEDFSSIQQRLDRSIADVAGSSSSAAEMGVSSASSHAGSSLSSGEMASIAAMFRDALQNASVYMDGRKVGRLITIQQLNSAMAKGV